ncbi:MAG: putative permease [Psychromonas sp.]|jgi:predicted permease|uniref:hypothetical protein n=1 Tax=Psychromonas sp. TaxID=1884585 RepID=UPI0039E35D34
MLEVAVLLAAMPMGVVVILPTEMYQLDPYLVNAYWLVTSLIFIVMLLFSPALLYCLQGGDLFMI